MGQPRAVLIRASDVPSKPGPAPDAIRGLLYEDLVGIAVPRGMRRRVERYTNGPVASVIFEVDDGRALGHSLACWVVCHRVGDVCLPLVEDAWTFARRSAPRYALARRVVEVVNAHLPEHLRHPNGNWIYPKALRGREAL